MHDLLTAKAVAGREKDIDFLSEAAKDELAQKNELLSRVSLLSVEPAVIVRVQALVRRVFP